MTFDYPQRRAEVDGMVRAYHSRQRLLNWLMIVSAILSLMLAAWAVSSVTTAHAAWCDTMHVTGYSEAAFSGQHTRDGTLVNGRSWTIAAVDPSVIPLQSTVSIPALGLELRAADTGGGVRGQHIDILVPTAADAYALTGSYLVCVS